MLQIQFELHYTRMAHVTSAFIEVLICRWNRYVGFLSAAVKSFWVTARLHLTLHFFDRSNLIRFSFILVDRSPTQGIMKIHVHHFWSFVTLCTTQCMINMRRFNARWLQKNRDSVRWLKQASLLHKVYAVRTVIFGRCFFYVTDNK